MADFRRRSIMQPPADARSNIPMPSTVKKSATHGGRMSMSGPALRAPYPVVAGPGPTPRHSMMRSQNMNPLLMSVSKPNFGRTPVQSNRRTSTWGGVQQSSAPLNSQPAKDPRPLRERPFQQKMRQDISAWFKQNDFDLQPQQMVNMLAKDFRGIFEQLVLLIEPDWPFDPNKRLEDQLLQALKSLHYPYVHVIDPKWLPTPSAQHSWPSLLGMLHWLAETGRDGHSYSTSQDPTLQEMDLVPDEFDNIHHHEALAFDYYINSYQLFLQGADLFPEEDRALEERYARKDEKVVSDLQQYKEKESQVSAELKHLTSSEPPIKELESMNRYMTSDIAKFEEATLIHVRRKQELNDKIAQKKKEIDYLSAEHEKLLAEQARLEEIVRAQNLSPEEVLRMNTEHDTLTRDLEHIKHKISESSKRIHTLEVSLGKKTADAEEAIDTYNGFLTVLGLFPPLPPPLEDVNLGLNMNSGAADPAQLVSGPSVRDVVKPTLARIMEMKKSENAEVEREKIELEDKLDKVGVACENKEQDVGEGLKKANALNEEAEDLRDRVQKEAAGTTAEIGGLEAALAQARSAAMTHGVAVKTRLHALQIAYAEQEDKVNRLRDETVRAIIKNSSEVVMFKEEVSRQLKQVHDFAEAN